MPVKANIPIYSIDKFRSPDEKSILFQVEVFDANRHFQVSYPHRHDFYEVLFLTNGSGLHIIDHDEYYIHPPCVFFLSPGQAHKLELSHDIEGYIFLFTSEFYLLRQNNKNRLLEFPFFFSVEQKNPPLLLKKKEDIDFMKSLFQRGVNEMAQKGNPSEEIIHSILDLILLTCDKLYPEKFRSLSGVKGHILAKKFLYLLEENYQNNYRVNDYAEMLAITPNHLTQIVKQATGRTSAELLQEKLIIEVKRLLIHTSMTVSEIAELMNFPDQSYFTKYFKKITGTTPLQYRKKSMKST
ncbi:MAG TPA: AraC family transcriptional regulator [Bacteroidales bacterium]|jgi:AraC family transcriptional activator of pobA|nr:AraC family transcriptional regulator [Bacteroidales bacterium]